jgi:hypothetical protein
MTYLDEMKKLNADGVIFHSIFAEPENEDFKDIYCEYTIKEMEQINTFPKSARTYYRIIDGRKAFIPELECFLKL